MNLSEILRCTFIYLFLACGFVPSLRAQSNDYSSIQKDLHTYLGVLRAKKGFSGEILVAKEDEIIFQESIGFASREHKLEMKNGAKYRIASISKTFTGVLVALALQENKLEVQDKAIHYIKALSPKFEEISIHQLLTHTSGLPHNEGIKDYWQTKSKLALSSDQILFEINELEVLFPPGTQMKYSSLGYYLLARVLETVYEDAYENILQQKILAKLDMIDTGGVNSLAIIPNMTSGYHWVKDDSLVKAPYRNYSMLKGAGDLYASSGDLLRWNQSFLTNDLLSEKSKASIFSFTQYSPNSRHENYGYGWFIRKEPPIKYYHGGGTWGFSSYLAFFPADKISIIVLSNVSSLPTESIVLDLEKMVFRQKFKMPVVEKEIQKDSVSLKKYSGNFISDSGKMRLRISYDKHRLFAQLAGNPAFEIYPKGEHQFFGKKIEISFTFEWKDEEVEGLSAERMGQTFHFNKASN